jgi:hypothetical protein
MEDKISFFSEDELVLYVKKVMTQTNYTEEEAKEKLRLSNCDYMKVIKDYMGISDKKEEKKVKSINQEIFRQIRTKLDTSMKEYREKNPINMEQVIENLKVSDEREKKKIKN